MAEVCERRGHVEMVQGIVPAGVDRAAEQRDRLLVGAEMELRQAQEMGPHESERIRGREPESLIDVTGRLFGPAHGDLRETYPCVRRAEIAIERGGSLELAD